MFQQSVYDMDSFPCIGIDNFGVECRVLVTDKPIYCTSLSGTVMWISCYHLICENRVDNFFIVNHV